MNRYQLLLIVPLLIATGVFIGQRMWFPAQAEAQAAPPVQLTDSDEQKETNADKADAGIRSITEQYVKAFNAKDAKTAAALWTENGEYIGVDGVEFRGRKAIEQSMAEDFKAAPKATIQIQLVSIRPVGRLTAVVEGVVKVKNPGQLEPTETRYSALQVLEDGVWRAASVREWIPNHEMTVAKGLLDWLVGDWTAKGTAGSISIGYAWNENKTFLIGKYSISKDGKTSSSGTEYLARDPNGGLRSWTFDHNGTFSNGLWQHEGNRWIDESIGTLPDGTVVESTNLLIVKGQDEFYWQTTERSADGIALPMLPPIQVTRAKPGK